MTHYDQQYSTELSLFGDPYPEFVAFIQENGLAGGKALDLGCGQGRDALMLAKHGYHVTAVDASKVGVEQMVQVAQSANLPVEGIVADFHQYRLEQTYDLILLDSILHFQKGDRQKELALLDRLAEGLNEAGLLAVFIHKSAKKEKILIEWLASKGPALINFQSGYIDYLYEEKQSGFSSQSPFLMLMMQRQSS